MESTSYAIFLCTRHNVAGNFFYKHDIVPGKSAQDNVLPLFSRFLVDMLYVQSEWAVELSLCNSLWSCQAATTARFSAFENKFHHHFFDLKRGL
ncbi:hypothetical protein T08_3154 [Trichinella sp. T8]|nr:hypothetical protein T08_3154 [Trichinella sp. T8]